MSEPLNYREIGREVLCGTTFWLGDEDDAERYVREIAKHLGVEQQDGEK